MTKLITKNKTFTLALSAMAATIFLIFGGLVSASEHKETNTVDDLEEKIKQQEERLEQLKKEAKKQRENYNQTRHRASSLEEKVEQFNQDVAVMESQIAVKKEKMQSTRLAIRKVNLKIEEKTKEVEKKKLQIETLLQQIYRTDDQSVIELVFKYEDFSNFFNQVQASKNIQETVHKELLNLKKLKVELEQAKKRLEKEQAQLEEEQNTLRNQKIVLERRRLSHRSLLAQTRREASEYKELLTEAQRKQKQIRQEIFELEQQLRFALDPSAIPEARPGLLKWPIENQWYLTQGYGCNTSSFARKYYPSCNDGAGGFHNGIDMGAPYGTALRAADSGVVKATGEAPYAYGNWVAIEHPNGLITAYTHMADIAVTGRGEQVEEGDVVGYMGSSGLSTGPHLHFMVYAADTFRTQQSSIEGILPIGATLNPGNYLP